jgi:hypothetical protein
MGEIQLDRNRRETAAIAPDVQTWPVLCFSCLRLISRGRFFETHKDFALGGPFFVRAD